MKIEVKEVSISGLRPEFNGQALSLTVEGEPRDVEFERLIETFNLEEQVNQTSSGLCLVHCYLHGQGSALDKARALSREYGIPVGFDSRREEDGHWVGFYGNAFSCGCIVFKTVLSNGSIGNGSWEEPCGIEHI